MGSRTFLTIAISVLSFILQIAVAPNIAIAGITPNFMLLVVVVAALVDGPLRGTVVGFTLGLVFDLVSSGPVGPYALVFTLVGFVAGSLQKNMFAQSWVIPLTVFGLSTLLAEVAYGAILATLGVEVAFWSSVLYRMIPSALYNTALALLVFPWITSALRNSTRSMNVKRRF